jgi:hypothetical protein
MLCPNPRYSARPRVCGGSRVYPAAFVSAARLLLERIGCCVCAVDPNASLRFSRAKLAVRPCAALRCACLAATVPHGDVLSRGECAAAQVKEMVAGHDIMVRCSVAVPQCTAVSRAHCGTILRSAVMPCGCLWHGAAVLEYSLVGGALTPIGTAGRRLRYSRSTPSPAQWLRSLSLG